MYAVAMYSCMYSYVVTGWPAVVLRTVRDDHDQILYTPGSLRLQLSLLYPAFQPCIVLVDTYRAYS